MSECRLCGLPVDDPVTDAAVTGTFCCRGCLQVHQAVDAFDAAEMAGSSSADDLRDELQGRAGAVPETDPEDYPDTAEETFLSISGMHCTTCETFLAIRGDRVDGVLDVDANYGTETAKVVYDPAMIAEDDLPDALRGYGYDVRFPDDDGAGSARASQRRFDTVQRLVVGGFFSMLVMPWYFFYLYPSYVGIETGVVYVDTTTTMGLYLPMAFIGLLTSVVLFYTGYPVLRGAWISVRTGQPNMDLLVSIAALSAYGYSTVALATGSTHLYYDVSVAVIMVVTLGRYYEDRIRAQATDVLSDLTAARVREAVRVTETGRETVDVGDLEPGDHVVVVPGGRIPVDGTVVEGIAAVDESVLSGESLPVTKRPGDEVIGGAVVTDDALVVAVGPEAESTADRIATALWEIQSQSPSVQRFADALATIFVPVVLVLGITVTSWQLLTGATVAAALLAGLTVLVVSCPCAMGLATPLAVSGGLRDALRRGVVVTNRVVFEVAPRAETMIFDKTGTLTTGRMRVAEVVGADDTLRFAAAVERYSDHPVADAVLDAVDGDGGWQDPDGTDPIPDDTDPVPDGGSSEVTTALEQSTVDAAGESGDVAIAENRDVGAPSADSETLPSVSGFARHPGEGVSGTVAGRDVTVGTPSLVERHVGPMSGTLDQAVADARADGALPVVVGWDDEVQGVIVLEDGTRAGWDAAVEAFADREVVVLTGDEGESAERFREHPAVDEVFAGVPPDGKAATVRRYASRGPTVMVGDGTNDAPALAAADLGIAMGDGTARATDAADVVIAEDDLGEVETVFDLAAGTRRRIRENVGWALCYNAIAIPLAVVGLINPLFAALAMAASSILVVTNSRRPVL